VATRNEHAFAQAKFTPKGVEWVAGLWGKHKARQAQEAGVQA
jgi:phage antirepressor YoqD-like protein